MRGIRMGYLKRLENYLGIVETLDYDASMSGAMMVGKMKRVEGEPYEGASSCQAGKHCFLFNQLICLNTLFSSNAIVQGRTRKNIFIFWLCRPTKRLY